MKSSDLEWISGGELGAVLMVLCVFNVIPVDAEMIDIPKENNRFEPMSTSSWCPCSVF